MTPAAIQAALLARMSAVNIPPALPNQDYSGARPYVEILPRIADRGDDTLKGEMLREVGRLAVNVVVTADTGTDAADGYAQTIVGLFPKALRLPLTGGGEIVIQRPADVRGGFNDGPDWKVPVVVHYSAFA
jgi:hypothetical protein